METKRRNACISKANEPGNEGILPFLFALLQEASSIKLRRTVKEEDVDNDRKFTQNARKMIKIATITQKNRLKGIKYYL